MRARVHGARRNDVILKHGSTFNGIMVKSSVASKTCTVKYMKKYEMGSYICIYRAVKTLRSKYSLYGSLEEPTRQIVIEISGKYIKRNTRNPTFSRRLFSDSGI